MEFIFSLSTLMLSPAAVAALVVAMYWIYPVPLLHGYQLFGGYIVAGLKRKFLYLKEFSYCYYERQPLADSGAEPPANAPTILFIHGFTSNKTMWMVVTKYLPKTWRIIILDLPGHGESSFKPEADYSPDGMVEKLNDFVEALDLHDIHLVGISLGAIISSAYAAKHPDKLKTLTAMCPPVAHRIKAELQTEFLSGLERLGEKSFLCPTDPEEFQKMIELVVFNPASYTFHYRMRQAIVDMQMPHYGHFKEIQRDLLKGKESEDDVRSALSNITVPTLLMWGDHDKICHPSGAQLLGDLLQDCKVVMLDKCGHAITMDRPRKCAQVIEDFISVRSAPVAAH